MKRDILLVVVLCVVCITPLSHAGGGPGADPDVLFEAARESRPVLGYLLSDPARLDRMQAELGLGSDRLEAIVAFARIEQEESRRLYRESQAMVMDEGLTPEGKIAAIEVIGYNEQVAAMVSTTAAGLEKILAPQERARFEEWLRKEWIVDRDIHHVNKIVESGVKGRQAFKTYSIYTTQYYGNYYDVEAALPDYYPKFANHGWEHPQGYPGSDYKVKLTYTSTSTIKLWDCGPWNIDDGYWNSAAHPERPRRMFADLPMGTPEAEAAYYNGYNGGKDQYGRTVIVPCGIDLTPSAASRIGLAYLQNAWITVTFLWEAPLPCAAVPVTEPGGSGTICYLALLLAPLLFSLTLRRRVP